MDKKIIYTLVAVVIVVGGIVSFVLANKNSGTTTAAPITSISAYDETQSADATSVTVQPNDLIQFTLTAQNSNKKTAIKGYAFHIDISSTVNSTSLTDASGATFNPTSNSLTWPAADIGANQEIQRNFVLKINQLAANTSGELSLQFNNEIHIAIGNSSVAQSSPSVSSNSTSSQTSSSTTAKTAPTTGANENLVIGLSLLTVLGAWFIRRRKVENSSK